MRTHVQILGWIFIVTNALGVLGAVFGLLAFLGLGLFVGVTGALEAIPIIGGLGVILFFFLLLFCLPGLIAGFGLLTYAPWARILTIVLAIIGLAGWPVGTFIGIYALYVLFQAETIRLFDGYRSY
jgi:hypothetical protein